MSPLWPDWLAVRPGGGHGGEGGRAAAEEGQQQPGLHVSSVSHSFSWSEVSDIHYTIITGSGLD